METQYVNIDRKAVPIEGERNLLELCRKAGIELPTFCYHSDISVYGACRMCMVDVEGMGIVPACSTKAKDGMVINTNTKPIRNMRKMIIELMLANHDQKCYTCPKSGTCRLQEVATQLGVDKVRFKQVGRNDPKDESSLTILRDSSKCILCGDCVRMCEENQTVGALGFAYRGVKAQVSTYFHKDITEVECVGCGQCVKVCPVGALTPKFEKDKVIEALYDKNKVVVAQIAPAVRVAIAEYFGKDPGTLSIGKIITALRRMGFDKVYDTCFGADFTVVEECKEFLQRKTKGENLPIFTSCCPAWVKFAEQYYPDFLANLSTCKSPHQMFGSLFKDQYATENKIPRENIVVVSVMPCTAKKFESKRDEFKVKGNPDVDHVITSSELALLIKESGINFDMLEFGSFDMPFGFFTGAAVIFGSSGGVSEAVLRTAAETLERGSSREFKQIRGNESLKESEITVGKETLKLAIVSGLGNARILIDKIRKGEANYDIVEVMACKGGCVNGGGQPITNDPKAVKMRTKGLYDNDKMLQFHESSENPYLQQIYDKHLTEEKAHHLLHTSFEIRQRIQNEDIQIGTSKGEDTLSLVICFGTSCFIRGAQDLYRDIMEHIRKNSLEDKISFKATFCGKQCKQGPVLIVNDKVIKQCTFDKAVSEITTALKK